jgi:hypothetical protein
MIRKAIHRQALQRELVPGRRRLEDTGRQIFPFGFNGILVSCHLVAKQYRGIDNRVSEKNYIDSSLKGVTPLKITGGWLYNLMLPSIA